MRQKFFRKLKLRWIFGLLAVGLLWRPVGATTSELFQSQSTQTTAPAQTSQQTNCPPPSSQSSNQPANPSSNQPATPPSTQPATTGNKNCPTAAKPANKPSPLFSGSLTIKKSQQTSDNTALGFNGVDSNGQVQKAFLSAAPTPESLQKAQAMNRFRPNPAEIAAFEKNGGLPSTSPAQMPQNPQSPQN